MTDQHDRHQGWAAAYVLGALEPGERAEFEAHLRDCRSCQDEVKDFASLPGLLGQVDPGDGPDGAVARVTELAVARASDDYGRLVSAGRRWRLAATASTAAAVALAVLLAVGALGGGGSDGTGSAGGDEGAPPVGPTLVVEAGAVGSVRIDPRGWGTNIVLELDGLPRRDRYRLWAVDDEGGWTVAATWGPTASGRARLTGAAAVDFSTVERIVITSDDRDDVVLTASA